MSFNQCTLYYYLSKKQEKFATKNEYYCIVQKIRGNPKFIVQNENKKWDFFTLLRNLFPYLFYL